MITGSFMRSFTMSKPRSFSMESGIIGKIQKAKRYAQEPERIRFEEFKVTFKGDHDTHTVSYEGGRWGCSCKFFRLRGVCSHTMAMERVLGVMLAQEKA
jgi:hypothetical protein